jgi:hypothetical protein
VLLENGTIQVRFKSSKTMATMTISLLSWTKLNSSMLFVVWVCLVVRNIHSKYGHY